MRAFRSLSSVVVAYGSSIAVPEYFRFELEFGSFALSIVGVNR